MPEYNNIGSLYSVAKKDTIIKPKDIPGYITPEGQVLKEDGQILNFIYTPIEYCITYDLSGGTLDKSGKETYTVEDEYIPDIIPTKQDFKFMGWNPEKIVKGTIGDITFQAQWKPKAVLLDGPTLNKKLNELSGSKEYIFAICTCDSKKEQGINISSTDNPIWAYYNLGIVYIYSEDDIYLNKNMESSFSGFTILRDISALDNMICEHDVDISSMFEDCLLLSNITPILKWKVTRFKDCLKNTLASSSGRVPHWYKQDITITQMSTTGKVINTYQDSRIPYEIIYGSSIKGYNCITKKIQIDHIGEYVFMYEPISYDIHYELSDGMVINPKTKYTIEDETYYPPRVIKSSRQFYSWYPECIQTGSIGNVSFIANYSEGG